MEYFILGFLIGIVGLYLFKNKTEDLSWEEGLNTEYYQNG